MLRLISLIWAVIRALFFSIIAVVVILVAVGLFAYSTGDDSSAITIESQPVWRRLSMDSETLSLYSTLSARAGEINTPLSNDSSPVPFAINAGETALAVGAKLQSLGLIHDTELFGQLLRYNNIDTRLQTGDYQLRRNMSMKQIALILYQGYASKNLVTIPPGWRLEQVATHLLTTGKMDGNQFLRLAQQGDIINHPVLADRPPGQSYEGYLYPDTYHLPDEVTPEHLIARMVDNMARKLPPNAFELAHRQGLTLHQVLTVASIVERESALPQERPIIASVYLNRLDPTSSETHLRADPTVQYAMGYQSDSGQWWKSPVSLEEYPSVDSPYNTYLYPGLPPGPIASPGIDSVMAVLHPANTNYLFFVCERPRCEGGRHVFARTYEEHLQNVAVYYGQKP